FRSGESRFRAESCSCAEAARQLSDRSPRGGISLPSVPAARLVVDQEGPSTAPARGAHHRPGKWSDREHVVVRHSGWCAEQDTFDPPLRIPRASRPADHRGLRRCHRLSDGEYGAVPVRLVQMLDGGLEGRGARPRRVTFRSVMNLGGQAMRHAHPFKTDAGGMSSVDGIVIRALRLTEALEFTRLRAEYLTEAPLVFASAP